MAVKIYDNESKAFKDAETPLIYDEGLQTWKESTGLAWNDGSQAWEERWRPVPSPLWLLRDGEPTKHGALSAEAVAISSDCAAYVPDVSRPPGSVRMFMPMPGSGGRLFNSGVVYLAKGLDVTEYKKAKWDHTLWVTGGYSTNANLLIGSAFSGISSYTNSEQRFDGVELDLSGIEGAVDVRFALSSRKSGTRGSEIILSDFWLEK